MDPQISHYEDLEKIRDFPDYNRDRAGQRFLLIKEYEDIFRGQEKARLGKAFRAKESVEGYCRLKNISVTSFYRWLGAYHRGGIKALVPKFGKGSKRFYYRHGKAITATIKFHADNPLLCLGQIKKVIENCPAIMPEVKSAALRFLSRSFDALKRKRDLELEVPLSDDELHKLTLYRAKNHKKQSAKATAILMANQNSPMIDVITATGMSINTIYRWLRMFNRLRLDFIRTKVHSPAREEKNDLRRVRIIDIIHNLPSSYGINRTSWTYETIEQAYKQIYDGHISVQIVQRIVHGTGFSWKRARTVWTSPDTHYREKIERVLETLRNLKDDEAFFFIDEAGPYQVKKYGGKPLVGKGEILTIPRFQLSKGEVKFFAALEAITNQITWIFVERKQASLIVELIRQLCHQYKTRSKLFLTWDAITTHSSKRVTTWIERHNETASKDGGPQVEVVPLPSNAQFLNVIEAVFSGMKRAIINNSDYASVEEMKTAISRHFEERNQYFKSNPKRAGNKIWDREAFDLVKLPGGLFKRM
jgi:transposase